MTGQVRYANKLVALADEMLAAQTRPQNVPPKGATPIEVDDYYATRNCGPVLGMIYDWVYGRLGASRRARMVALMNAYFDDMRKHAYEVNDHASGNYMMGHLLAAAWMGYASYGDNPRARQMIDWARIRFDGTPSALVPGADVPTSNIAQVFDGGYLSGAGKKGAPFKSGFDFQGWAYGTGTLDRLFDYMQIVDSASGQDLIVRHRSWLAAILRAEIEAMQPDRFQIDPRGDWGGDYGAAINRSLPLRLAYLLRGTKNGPYAEHFAHHEVNDRECRLVPTCQPAAWEDFFFGNPHRPSRQLHLPPYYSAFRPAYPGGKPGNGAMPYFIMRGGFGVNAVWASAVMGAAWYDDHQHADAGHIMIRRGKDFLLVSGADWKGGLGSKGYLGSSNEDPGTSAGNTLYFNDLGDSQCADEAQYAGGQGDWGVDAVIADEENAAGTYVRSNLTSAYNTGGSTGCYQSRLQERRALGHFYRSFLYLRKQDLFVVFDQVEAKKSTSPRGKYLMHLRWHFPNRPEVKGRRVTVKQGGSRLIMDTVLPARARLSVVDERRNPDGNDCSSTPCTICERGVGGARGGCTPFGEEVDSGTMRVEVRTPSNPRSQTFLTVFQAGGASMKASKVSEVKSRGGIVEGVQVTRPSGAGVVALFDAWPGAVPRPIGTATYRVAGNRAVRNVLTGLSPGGRYTASRSGNTITIRRDPRGALRASPAGVMRFNR